MIDICRRDCKFHHDKKKKVQSACLRYLQRLLFFQVVNKSIPRSKRLCIGNQPRQIDRMTSNRINNNISRIFYCCRARSISVFINRLL